MTIRLLVLLPNQHPEEAVAIDIEAEDDVGIVLRRCFNAVSHRGCAEWGRLVVKGKPCTLEDYGKAFVEKFPTAMSTVQTYVIPGQGCTCYNAEDGGRDERRSICVPDGMVQAYTSLPDETKARICSVVQLEEDAGTWMIHGTKDDVRTFKNMVAASAARELQVTSSPTLLLQTLPSWLSSLIKKTSSSKTLEEIFVHVGLDTQLREYDTEKGQSVLRNIPDSAISQEEAEAMSKAMNFCDDRYIVPGDTPHRIARIRHPYGDEGDPVGYTLRLARWVRGLADPLDIYLRDRKSILIIGPPNSGKTTLMRDLVRKASASSSVSVIDYFGELCGFGVSPSQFVGPVRRFSVRDRSEKVKALDNAISNHNPDYIIHDEVMTEDEALGLSNASHRGIATIASVHSHTLEDVVNNTTYSQILGGIQNIIFSYQERMERDKRRKAGKERVGKPSFDIVLEMRGRTRWVVVEDVAGAVDNILDEKPYTEFLRVISRK